MTTVDPVRDERRFLALLLLTGLALRLIWFVHALGPLDNGFDAAEASRVALAVAEGHGIADAYYPGYGPTAHLMPVSSAIAGLILWLFGPGSAAANLALLAWCLAQVAAAYILLHALFQSLGAPVVVRRWGFALLCLLTPFALQETIDFRYWEGAAALCLAVANLLLISRFDVSGDLSRRDMIGVSVLFAITFFVCPPAGVAAGACWAVFALRRLSLVRCAQLALLTGAALALVIAPWAVRNDRVLGEPILLRSNFGLEFALANHAKALSDRAPELVLQDRLAEIHPYEASVTLPHRVRPGGEAAYARVLGDQTWRWVAANPGGFAILCVRHISEFFFPRPWQMYFTGWPGMRAPRAIAISLVNLLGLIGLGIGLYRRRRGYAMLATYIAAISLPYALFQPTARYIYLAYAVLAFLAVDALVACVGALKGMSRRQVAVATTDAAPALTKSR